MIKEKVLITGGAGYLGSVLSEQLLNNGYEVTCIDNLMHKQNSLLHLINRPGFDFVFGDVRDEEIIKGLLKTADAILPLAALVGDPICRTRQFDATTVNRDAVKMINQLRSSNQKIVFPTTNSGYGRTTSQVYCTEDSPLEPISHYGRTKVEAEREILESGKKGLTLRLATVFGVSPRMRTDLLVNDFVLKAVRDRNIPLFEEGFMRNYIHIRDTARAFEHAIVNYDAMSGPYNVGDDRVNMSKLQLAQKIKEHVPDLEITEMQGEDPDKRNYIVSSEKIKKTGFGCAHTLDEGIKELIKCYKLLLKLDSNKNS